MYINVPHGSRCFKTHTFLVNEDHPLWVKEGEDVRGLTLYLVAVLVPLVGCEA